MLSVLGGLLLAPLKLVVFLLEAMGRLLGLFVGLIFFGIGACLCCMGPLILIGAPLCLLSAILVIKALAA